MCLGRRKLGSYLLATLCFLSVLYFWNFLAVDFDFAQSLKPTDVATHDNPGSGSASSSTGTTVDDDDPSYFWRTLPVRHTITSMRALPTGSPQHLPKIQATFAKEQAQARATRLQRQAAVKDAFLRCWRSYKTLTWKSDELAPISGASRNWFGGWGATLVDSLDTLWIMGLHDEFNEAVAAAANISFESTNMEEINVFETNIRYLGGFLAAYDLSGDPRLLHKAREVADMLYVAFDTPNRMPITRWNPRKAAAGETQVAHDNVLMAEMGSFTLEFARLSIITGNNKWFDAAQRIMEIFDQQQQTTQLPGLWPLIVNAQTQEFNKHTAFTLGAMADSTYEYLPKMYALLGGLMPEYRRMYESAMTTAIKHNLFRPMTPDGKDIRLSGIINTKTEGGKIVAELEPQGQHLVCFAGGMLALGGKLCGLPDHIDQATKLVDGCIWSYQALPLGIMPETFYMVPCQSTESCHWDEEVWKKGVLERSDVEDKDDLSAAESIIGEKRLPMGFVSIPDTRYILRPEAIESIFVLYRITGRKDLLESAWTMFEAIQNQTQTELANSALSDVTVTNGEAPKSDSMESFWLGETLKYFYLIFSDPDLVSLDEYGARNREIQRYYGLDADMFSIGLRAAAMRKMSTEWNKKSILNTGCWLLLFKGLAFEGLIYYIFGDILDGFRGVW